MFCMITLFILCICCTLYYKNTHTKNSNKQHILPQCSSSLLSPQSSSWSHLKARGMQDPEATQRNWLDGSHVIVANSGKDTKKDTWICIVLSCIYHYRHQCLAEYLRHSCSSLMSPQSLSLSHFQMLLMQRPLEQRYWLGIQLCSDWRKWKITCIRFFTIFKEN